MIAVPVMGRNRLAPSKVVWTGVCLIIPRRMEGGSDSFCMLRFQMDPAGVTTVLSCYLVYYVCNGLWYDKALLKLKKWTFLKNLILTQTDYDAVARKPIFLMIDKGGIKISSVDISEEVKNAAVAAPMAIVIGGNNGNLVIRTNICH